MRQRQESATTTTGRETATATDRWPKEAHVPVLMLSHMAKGTAGVDRDAELGIILLYLDGPHNQKEVGTGKDQNQRKPRKEKHLPGSSA